MIILFEILFFLSVFVIFFAMIGYPVLLIILDKILKPEKNIKDYTYEPSVTLMIVAHNEEKVIEKKLENALELDYPVEKFNIIVASDNSTDGTNEIAEKFIVAHKDRIIRLFKSEERKGKTNAQNEAQKEVNSELLVMTDANSIITKNSIRELAASFVSDDIAYVCGSLKYINANEASSSTLESTYWNLDLRLRDIESRFQTITAGNGAIYACRNREYVDFDPIKCHDSSMPLFYGLHQKKALFNPDAIAYEKAGESNQDEFSRKVRMSRIIAEAIFPSSKILNIVKYKWFSLFYFGHRTCRYLLWLAHMLAITISLLLGILGSRIFIVLFTCQIVLYITAVITLLVNDKFKSKYKFLNMLAYYCLTVSAQIVGVFKIISGQAKPFWEKAESTR